MPDRRAVLKFAAGAVALAAPVGGAAVAAPAPAAKFYLVDGWILTREDVEALGRPPARPLG